MSAMLIAALAAVVASATEPGAGPSERATPEEVAEAQTRMFRDYDQRVMEFARRLSLAEPWITYCRVQMNEEHSGHVRDGTLPFGIDYKSLNKDQLEPLVRILGAYEEGFMTKCLADARASLRAAGVD